MQTVYVFLAEGFEEIEAITPVDLLRRAGIEVKTVGVGGQEIPGSHGVRVRADVAGEGFVLPADAVMVVLPGGGLGTQNLAASGMVAAVLAEAAARDIYIAAICAAPTVLHKVGLLAGRRATAFPDVQASLTGSTVTGAPVEVDGKVITGRSAGVALQFARALVAALAGAEKADAVLASLYPEQAHGAVCTQS